MADTPHHTGLLSGCRVLDFTQYLAGPMVIRLMAEMGAEIIKVAIAPVLHGDLSEKSLTTVFIILTGMSYIQAT